MNEHKEFNDIAIDSPSYCTALLYMVKGRNFFQFNT